MEEYLNKSKKHIKPIDREDATLEAEKGETVLTCLSDDGIPDLLIIDGKPHSKGGTPLDIPDNSFIYSKYKYMKIKDEVLQDDFMMKRKKSGYTPAEISKKYLMSNERDILNDKNSTDLERHTAELMIKNKVLKLGELALAQESLKAYDDGIPFVSIPYMQSIGMDIKELYPNKGQQENHQQMMQEQPQEMEATMQQAMMARTGIRRVKRYKTGGAVLSQYQTNGSVKTYTDDEINDYWGKSSLSGKNNWRNSSYNYSHALGSYGNQLTTLKEFFINHNDLLDKLYNTWKTNETTKPYSSKMNDKMQFLDHYCNWLLTKQAWLGTKEDGKEAGYWDQVVPGSRAKNGRELKRRNTREYSNAFQQFAGLDDDMIKLFQSMDYAMNEFAKSDDGKKYGFTTNDYWDEDINSDAGASSSTQQGNRNGVSIIDGFFGQRTADFLPFIGNPNVDDVTEESKDEDVSVNAEKMNETYPKIPNDWFTQDKNNLNLALNNRMNILEPRPYMPQVGYEEGNPHYMDYRTDAARIASNATSIANGMGMSANPDQDVVMAYALNQNSNDAVMKLQQQEQAQNVNIANNYDRFNTQQRNAHYVTQADLDKKYYDSVQIGRQQKRNAINKANQQLVNTINHGMTNAQTAYNQSLINTEGEFFVNPWNGHIERNPYYSKDINPHASPDDMEAYTKSIQKLAEDLHISEEKAAELINDRFAKQKEAARQSQGLAQLASIFNQPGMTNQ